MLIIHYLILIFDTDVSMLIMFWISIYVSMHKFNKIKHFQRIRILKNLENSPKHLIKGWDQEIQRKEINKKARGYVQCLLVSELLFVLTKSSLNLKFNY